MCRRASLARGELIVSPRAEELVRDVLDRFPERPDEAQLVAYLDRRGERAPGERRRVPTRVATAELGFELADVNAVAALLDVDRGELEWLADERGWSRRAPEPLLHYRWQTIPKAGGVRVVAAPKPRLKEAQRRLLRHVVSAIPLHDAAHGAVPKRSVRTALLPHAGSRVVLRMDLAAFYPSITAPRITGLLETVGVEPAVARVLSGLATTIAPLRFWQRLPLPADRVAHRRLGELLRTPHLPTGAPTSAALANAVSYRLDRRLAALADRSGARYTRYVDDLIFSGGPRLARQRWFAGAVEAIVLDEGFTVARHKTAVRPAHTRQALLGAVVNERPALPRVERDRLRAIVHNCVVHGAASQGVDRARLLGRVSAAQALDPAWGAKLRDDFNRIAWD
ncbi:MAG: hypothetical protein JWQ77_3763 [Jatrophihabitans sp.]|nr:hypothetical protein [Jatrophihabitans sp.]